MAEMGAHSALSGAIGFAVNQPNLPLSEKAAIVMIVSIFGHFLLDLFPHGHTKKIWKEMISGAIIVPVILFLAFRKGGVELAFLSCVSIFFGNLFDALLTVSRWLKSGFAGKIGKAIINLNLWIHWFVRSQTFCRRVRQEVSKETWKGRPVYSWKYGWYNLVPLVFSLIALYASLAL